MVADGDTVVVAVRTGGGEAEADGDTLALPEAVVLLEGGTVARPEKVALALPEAEPEPEGDAERVGIFEAAVDGRDARLAVALAEAFAEPVGRARAETVCSSELADDSELKAEAVEAAEVVGDADTDETSVTSALVDAEALAQRVGFGDADSVEEREEEGEDEASADAHADALVDRVVLLVTLGDAVLTSRVGDKRDERDALGVAEPLTVVLAESDAESEEVATVADAVTVGTTSDGRLEKEAEVETEFDVRGDRLSVGCMVSETDARGEKDDEASLLGKGEALNDGLSLGCGEKDAVGERVMV